MKKAKQPSSFGWYDRRVSALCFGIAALIAGYFVALRAMFTGSLQQYALVFALAIFAINRLVYATHRHRKAAV